MHEPHLGDLVRIDLENADLYPAPTFIGYLEELDAYVRVAVRDEHLRVPRRDVLLLQRLNDPERI